MDVDFQKTKLEYEKKAEELRLFVNNYFSGKSKPTKEETNVLLSLNFEVQSLCEVLLERKAKLEPHLGPEIKEVLKRSRSNTYNC